MKLYVGNITYDATETDLEQAFSEFGEVVSVNILKDNQTGKPRGYGFVEMASDEECKAAMDAMDGVDFKGRNLKVAQAQEKPRTQSGGGGRGRSGGSHRGGGGGGGGRRFGNRSGGGSRPGSNRGNKPRGNRNNDINGNR
jgi:RNA recognition motif-containing protein